MKNSILLFFTLFLLFSCNHSNKTKIKELEGELKHKKDSLELVENELYIYKYFTLELNDYAKEFFQSNGIENAEDFIITQLMATNITKDARHPLISYEPRNNRKFQINSVRVLNHRWLICDFSDGLDWGELLVAFYLSEDNKSLEFKVFDTTLYVSDKRAYQK